MTEVSQPSLTVFLAHSRGDKDLAREIFCLLRADGFHAWFDEENLLPGQDWEYEIKKAVRKANAVAAFLSPRSVDAAGYLHKELALALDTAQQQPEGTIFLIPIRLGECEVPERVRHLHWLDVDPADARIGPTYRRLQRSLLRRALQLGLMEASDLAAERFVFPGPKTGKGDRVFSKADFVRSVRYLGLGVEGNYLVRGQNPNGTRYYGTAEISEVGDSLTLMTRIGPHILKYVGRLDGFMLAFTGAHDIKYSVEAGGSLLGRWGGEGVEELIPASPFASQQESADA